MGTSEQCTGRPRGEPSVTRDATTGKHRVRTDGGELSNTPRAIPDSAEAVDVPCPHCGQRPIETVAKGYRITGMILVMQQKTLQFVGCQHCVRRKLWWAATKNVLIGWWGIKSAILNPFAIAWNVVRSLVSRGPNEHLVDALDETGIPFEFVDDGDAFQPGDHHQDELIFDGLLRLGAAIMLADGDVDESEVETVLDVTREMFPDRNELDVERRLKEFARDQPIDVAGVSEGLGVMLTEEGKQLVVAFAMDVAGADGEIDDEEIGRIESVAENVGISEREMEDLLAA